MQGDPIDCASAFPGRTVAAVCRVSGDTRGRRDRLRFALRVARSLGRLERVW